MAEINDRYKRGMVYTIRNIKDDEMIYVGSTINNLSKRFDNHKTCCKAGVAVSLYSHIENNDWTDWYIELYEAYPCNNKKELNRREGEVIREIGTINKNIAGRTQKEYEKDIPEYIKEYKKKYREENADKIKENKKKYRECNAEKLKEYQKKYYKDNPEYSKEYKKKYREDNRDKLKEKVCCNICGAFSTKDGLTRHQKSKKCMSKSLDNIGTPSDIHI